MTIFEKTEEESIFVEDEMKSSYLDYAMSVIVSRALPDVRDGLKPVHRRILYAMDEGGYTATKPYRKSARIVGDVMGKYHPHGNDPIYDAMVRMKQEFAMNLPLIDGQGNFGSMDGDSPAAMRYTEARLAKSASTMLEDIDKDTVNFRPNYDESSVEPEVLPVPFPNLLVNGGSGIAVGMATSIAPHNLTEVCNACLAYLHDPEMSDEELIEIVPGPDFPTGAQIIGRRLSRHALMTGRGSIKIRGTCEIEEISKGRHSIVCTAVPYQVNKARLVERIAELVRNKTIEGVSDLRDESSREGVRVVIDLKRDAVPEFVLKQVYHHTPMQTTFSVNMLALDGTLPRNFTLKQAIEAFVKFRDEVIYRRTSYLLFKARERGHVVIGLMVAIGNLDEVITLIRASSDRAEASNALRSRTWAAAIISGYLKLLDEYHDGEDTSEEYRLSEKQTTAILDLRLHRLTGLEREKLEAEARELATKIKEYFEILENKQLRWDIITLELTAARDTYGVERRSEFVEDDTEMDILDLVAKEDIVVVITHGGYAKRVPLKTYRAQRRGGKGRTGMSTKDDDGVSKIFVATTHTKVLFFSSFGRVYLLQAYKLPIGSPQSKGKALVNQLPLSQEESITAVLVLPEDESSVADKHVMFATAKGYVRRNKLSDFQRVLANGKTAMKLIEGDRLVAVKQCSGDDDVFLSTTQGMAIRFSVEDVRVFQGRDSKGVRGVRLDSKKADAVVGMEILEHHRYPSEDCTAFLKVMVGSRRSGDPTTLALSPLFKEMQEKEQLILTVTDDGMGRLYSVYDYRITSRGGKGILNVKSKKGTGVVSSFVVEKDDQIMLIADDGQIIRMSCDKIRQVGRPSMGVKLFDLGGKTNVASVVRLGDMKDDNGFDGDDSEDQDDNDLLS